MHKLTITEELSCWNGQVHSGDKLLMVVSGPTRESVESALAVRFPDLIKAAPAVPEVEEKEAEPKPKKAKA